MLLSANLVWPVLHSVLAGLHWVLLVVVVRENTGLGGGGQLYSISLIAHINHSVCPGPQDLCLFADQLTLPYHSDPWIYSPVQKRRRRCWWIKLNFN